MKPKKGGMRGEAETYLGVKPWNNSILFSPNPTRQRLRP